ncbi:hypothetical protein AVEN_61043-1 [Araneus ventricosus]|uniref:Uncharacterized protein n=1 Tax=Araneus ventricosus TaxID=182803 RepID=A0A4Y2DXG4_ARAVE|nr:hypothetical protein AVEN_61043-1 [Araneus ventricosus]
MDFSILNRGYMTSTAHDPHPFSKLPHHTTGQGCSGGRMPFRHCFFSREISKKNCENVFKTALFWSPRLERSGTAFRASRHCLFLDYTTATVMVRGNLRPGQLSVAPKRQCEG